MIKVNIGLYAMAGWAPGTPGCLKKLVPSGVCQVPIGNGLLSLPMVRLEPLAWTSSLRSSIMNLMSVLILERERGVPPLSPIPAGGRLLVAEAVINTSRRAEERA
jgi:hypothetical protein